MRVALLISGYLRNYEVNLKFIEDEIIKKFEKVDVYLHITKNENFEDKYFNKIEDSDIKFIIDSLNPIMTIIEPNTDFCDNKTQNNTLNHWSKLYKLNELKKINEKSSNFSYDLVIRYRPDLSIVTKDLFSTFYDNKIIIPKDSKIDKSKLSKHNDNYICDGLAFGPSELMDKYFKIYENISNLMSDYGPVSETILYEHLNNNLINYSLSEIDYSFILSKCNVFAICGDSGSGKTTLSNLLKNSFIDSFMLECDRYHKWERYDDNWNKVTHLNPNANYITKMNEDIFNLKIGNDVYQVDYDHNTGKFTEKQIINPSQNLIVCGLHSLYNENDSLYNLKIYMDTDNDLKIKWKILRDVKERGYSVDKVLDSIKKREDDFNTYITPQKNNADIIIRFFTTEKIDFNNLDVDTPVSLELSIRNVFKINHIIDELKINKIDFKVLKNENFNKLIFQKYVNFNISNHLTFNKSNSFYDYILIFILNMNFTN